MQPFEQVDEKYLICWTHHYRRVQIYQSIERYWYILLASGAVLPSTDNYQQYQGTCKKAVTLFENLYAQLSCSVFMRFHRIAFMRCDHRTHVPSNAVKTVVTHSKWSLTRRATRNMLAHVEPRNGRTMQNYILVPTLVEWAVFFCWLVGQLSKSIWTGHPQLKIKSCRCVPSYIFWVSSPPPDGTNLAGSKKNGRVSPKSPGGLIRGDPLSFLARKSGAIPTLEVKPKAVRLSKVKAKKHKVWSRSSAPTSSKLDSEMRKSHSCLDVPGT